MSSQELTRRPAVVIADALRLRLSDADLASDLAADVLFALREDGYRIAAADVIRDQRPVDIVTDSLVAHTRIARIAARGAAGWALSNLNHHGWRLLQVNIDADP